MDSCMAKAFGVNNFGVGIILVFVILAGGVLTTAQVLCCTLDKLRYSYQKPFVILDILTYPG